MADVSFGGPQLPRRPGHRQDFRVSRPSPSPHTAIAIAGLFRIGALIRSHLYPPIAISSPLQGLAGPLSAADGNRHGDLGNRGCVRRHSPGIETARPSDSSERCVGCGAGPPACPSGFEQRQALGRGPRAHTHQLLKRALANPLSRTAASLPPRQMPHRCGPLHAVGQLQR